jgi:hypothetical protein
VLRICAFNGNRINRFKHDLFLTVRALSLCRKVANNVSFRKQGGIMWRSVLALLLVPSIAWAREKSLQVSEKQETVASGEHLLRAKVTLQSISDIGVLPPQQIEVQLPVTVVDHDTEAKNAKTARSDAGGTPVLLWILAPLLIPLMVVMAIVCGIRDEDCSC